MYLEELYEDLANGELRAHAWAMNGTIADEHKEKIVSNLNVCLTDLYTRFPLLTKQLTLIQHSGITEYVLTREYAQTNKESLQPIKYIYDTDKDPFQGNVLRIESVFDEIGDELVLNAEQGCKVALTPAPDVLEIPNPVETNALFVNYRTRPNKVTTSTIDIPVPEQFRPAILAYVAYRAYSGSSDVNQNALALANFQRYELLCSQYVNANMINTDESVELCNFTNGGWV